MTTFGERVEAFRLTAKNGKRMGRLEFGALAGLTPTKIRNIETGREPTDAEIDALVRAYPALGATVFEQSTSDPAAERPQLSLVPPSIEPGEPAVVPSSGPAPGHTLDDATEHDDTAAATVDLETIETVNGDGEVDSTELEPIAATAPAPTTPAVNFDDGARRFSNSEIQTFKRCKRKWWLAWYRKLKLKVEDPTGARAIGDRVHRALMAWYAPDGQERTDPRDALERVIVEDWTKMTAAADERGYDLAETDIPARFEQDTSLERRMVAGYVEWLAEEGPDQGIRVVGSETYVEADIAEAMKLIGKVDARIVRELDGARLFIDHKTVGDLTGPVKTLHMDEQMLYYHLLEWLNQLDEGGRAAGAIYNMLRKVKRTGSANPPFYGRVEVHHNDIELTNFLISTYGTIEDILATAAKLDAGVDHHRAAYASRRKECAWDCDFFPICPMFDDGSRVDAAIEQYYTEGDPLAYYGEKVPT